MSEIDRGRKRHDFTTTEPEALHRCTCPFFRGKHLPTWKIDHEGAQLLNTTPFGPGPVEDTTPTELPTGSRAPLSLSSPDLELPAPVQQASRRRPKLYLDPRQPAGARAQRQETWKGAYSTW